MDVGSSKTEAQNLGQEIRDKARNDEQLKTNQKETQGISENNHGSFKILFSNMVIENIDAASALSLLESMLPSASYSGSTLG